MNLPVESERPEANGMKAIRFARTKALPTYLVALAVGPFEIVEAGRGGKSQTPICIVTPKGEAAVAKFAAETTPRVLEWFENYLGVPYARTTRRTADGITERGRGHIRWGCPEGYRRSLPAPFSRNFWR
jgi:aminopeptidase N